MPSVFIIPDFAVAQSNALLGHEKAKAEEERGEAKVQLKDVILERDQLRGKVQEQNSKVDQLSQAIQECKTTERLLEQRAKQLEVRIVFIGLFLRVFIDIRPPDGYSAML